MRAKTPEERSTPIPMESFSDEEGSEDLSKPPKTPDIHLSDTDDAPGTPSPTRTKDKKTSAMEALMALGLDEFVGEIKIKENKDNRKKEKPIPVISPPLPSEIKTKSKIKEEKKDGKEDKRNKYSEKLLAGEISDKENELTDKRKMEKMEIINGDHFSEKMSDSEIVDKDVNKLDNDASKDEKIEVDVDDDRSRSSPESQIQIEHSYSRPKDRNQSSSDSPASESEIRKKQEIYTREHDYTSKAKSPLTPKLDDNRYEKSSTKEIKKSSEKLVSHLLDTYLKPEKVVPTRFRERDYEGEINVCFEFLTKGKKIFF